MRAGHICIESVGFLKNAWHNDDGKMVVGVFERKIRHSSFKSMGEKEGGRLNDGDIVIMKTGSFRRMGLESSKSA